MKEAFYPFFATRSDMDVDVSQLYKFVRGEAAKWRRWSQLVRENTVTNTLYYTLLLQHGFGTWTYQQFVSHPQYKTYCITT